METETSTMMPFEEALEKLQQTVRQMESGELTLEQSLKAFEQGVHFTRVCQGQLANAESKIELLSQKAMQEGRIETGPMPPFKPEARTK